MVVKVDPLTGAQTLIPAGALLDTPIDLTVGGLSGDLFILDSSAAPGMTAGIVRKNPSTGVESLVPTGAFPDFPSRIAADGSDHVYLTFLGPPARVLGFDGTTRAPTTIAEDDLLDFPTDIDAIPLPEPGPLLAQLCGIGCLAALARRRARSG